MARNSYNTAAKRMLLDYLITVKDRQLSANEIYEGLLCTAKDGAMPGKSTLYRLLAALHKEGVLSRFSADHRGVGGYIYQYVGDLDCKDHFHLKCLSCGRILHLECKRTDSLICHISDGHGFSVDRGMSVLYGTCSDCSGQKVSSAKER